MAGLLHLLKPKMVLSPTRFLRGFRLQYPTEQMLFKIELDVGFLLDNFEDLDEFSPAAALRIMRNNL